MAISEGSNWGWTSAGVLGLLAASAVLFTVWVRIEQRVPEPLVDLETFARREMAATNVTTLVMGFSMFSTFILLPNFVQVPLGLPPDIADQLDYGFGATPVEVGLFFIPSSVAMIIAGPLAGALGQRSGSVIPLRVGVGFLVLALVLLATVHDEPWTIYAWMVFMGIGLAFCFASLGTLVIAVLAAGGDRRRQRHEHDHAHDRRRARLAGRGRDHLGAHARPGTEIPIESGFTIAFTRQRGRRARRAPADLPAHQPSP